MGFPYENPSWDGVSGVIFAGGADGPTLFFSVIAIGICIGALLLGNGIESGKYKNHK